MRDQELKERELEIMRKQTDQIAKQQEQIAKEKQEKAPKWHHHHDHDPQTLSVPFTTWPTIPFLSINVTTAFLSLCALDSC